jgi:hypothetical protein
MKNRLLSLVIFTVFSQVHSGPIGTALSVFTQFLDSDSFETLFLVVVL